MPALNTWAVRLPCACEVVRCALLACRQPVQGGSWVPHNDNSMPPCQVRPVDLSCVGCHSPPHDRIQEWRWPILVMHIDSNESAHMLRGSASHTT
jgi:hypothetical protein